MKITMRDLRACNMCSRGARKFFERHNLDWNDFIKNGVDCDVVAKTKDAMAMKVVDHVRGQ
mgnify:CR=1 FL=1